MPEPTSRHVQGVGCESVDQELIGERRSLPVQEREEGEVLMLLGRLPSALDQVEPTRSIRTDLRSASRDPGIAGIAPTPSSRAASSSGALLIRSMPDASKNRNSDPG